MPTPTNILNVQEIDFKIGMQFDVSNFMITIYNAFPENIQSRMTDEGGTTEDVFMTRKEFGEMLHSIETDNTVRFVKER